MNYLPNKLLKLRKHYGHSQYDVANICGVDTLEYMNYENGNSIPNYAVIKKLANFYHVSVDEMFANDEKVTLHNVSENTTDDLNIKYFTKKSITRDISNFIKRNKIVTGIIVTLIIVIVILSLVLSKSNKPVEIVRENINRISASSTNVVYIDNTGAVQGTGDNSNSQISMLPTSGAMKVCEGEGFTIVLKEDGTVVSIGLLSKYANLIEKWSNIVDIACGNNHVLGLDSKGRIYAVGDNSNGQCDCDGQKDVSKIYASSTASILLNNDGSLTYTGNFIGSSSLKNYTNILDIAVSDNILAILKADKTVDVYTKNSNNYLEAENFVDIVDVACGNDFVAGLTSDGKVCIDIDHVKYKNEVTSWENIICIASSSDYLVAYDGKTIKGVGKNKYKQFEANDVINQILPQVSNVKIYRDEDYLCVSFDEVANASGYSISIDLGTGINKTIEEVEVVKFDIVNMQDSQSYKISIVALGNDDYLDSSPYVIDYLFKVDEDTDEKEEDDEVITIGEVIDLSKTKFDSYLAYLGIPSENISASESEDICPNQEVIITEVSGLAKGEKVTSSEISNRKIKYKYCKIVEVVNDEPSEDLQDQQ